MTRILLGAGALVLLVLAYFAIEGRDSSDDGGAALENGGAAEAVAAEASVEEVSAEEALVKDHVLGEADAPLTIIEYASFTCPHCENFHKTVWPEVKAKYVDTGKAKLIYREVYFDGPGLLAASLARCVRDEQYYPMVSTLYDTTDTWLRSQQDVDGVIVELTKLGVMAGLPKKEISACLDNRESQGLMIENSTKNLEADGVTGTPTLIVNGKKPKSWDWKELEPFLDAELAAAGGS